jgi:tRNA 2-thiouridine synthesizing protein E
MPPVDKEGFLRNLADWDVTVAEALAAAEGITLTAAHWQIIDLVRAYYEAYHISPATRVLVNLLKRELGPERGHSIYLMKLFTGKPARAVSKISGLPKPANCD